MVIDYGTGLQDLEILIIVLFKKDGMRMSQLKAKTKTESTKQPKSQQKQTPSTMLKFSCSTQSTP